MARAEPGDMRHIRSAVQCSGLTAKGVECQSRTNYRCQTCLLAYCARHAPTHNCHWVKVMT